MPDKNDHVTDSGSRVTLVLRESFGEQTPLALIAADVDRVQNYVFESAKLAEMRGASLILDLLNVKDSDEPEKWGDVHIDGRPIKGIPQVLTEEFGLPHECLIYNAGGGALILAPWDQAEAIKKRIEVLYLNTTLTATITVAYEPVSWTDLENGIEPPNLAGWFAGHAEVAIGEASRLMKHNLVGPDEWNKSQAPAALILAQYSRRKCFGEWHSALGYKLRCAKQRKATAPIFEVSPFTERCSYCHYRPACRLAPEIDERPICQVCHRKRQDHDGRAAHSFYLRGFQGYLESEAEAGNELRYWKGTKNLNWVEIESPPDLKAIAEAGSGRDNFVGIIYADGNNIGGEIERLKTLDEFHVFAEEVRDAVEKAVFRSLGDLLDGHCKTTREYRDKEGRKRERNHKHHPFEIVSIGGDDVYLFVPADVALEVALRLCRTFEGTLAHRDRNLTLAASVLIAHVTTPVYFSRQIAKGLLKNAKRLRTAAGNTVSAVDFQVITSDTSIAEDIASFRSSTYRNRNEGLTTRPLRLDQLQEMIDVIRELKRTKFPKTQLYSLRDAVVRGPQPRVTNFYYYQQARSNEMKKHYATLHAYLEKSGSETRVPFQKSDDADFDLVTPIVDLIEIYDFVREAQPATNQENA